MSCAVLRRCTSGRLALLTAWHGISVFLPSDRTPHPARSQLEATKQPRYRRLVRMTRCLSSITQPSWFTTASSTHPYFVLSLCFWSWPPLDSTYRCGRCNEPPNDEMPSVTLASSFRSCCLEHLVGNCLWQQSSTQGDCQHQWRSPEGDL